MTGASAAVTLPAIWRLFAKSLPANAAVLRTLASYAVSPSEFVTFWTKWRSRCTPPAAKVAYAEAMSDAVTAVPPPPIEMLLSPVNNVLLPPSSLVRTPASFAASATPAGLVTLRTMS